MSVEARCPQRKLAKGNKATHRFLTNNFSLVKRMGLDTLPSLLLQIVDEMLFCVRCKMYTSHLVVNSGELNCYAICQICSKGRVWSE